MDIEDDFTPQHQNKRQQEDHIEAEINDPIIFNGNKSHAKKQPARPSMAAPQSVKKPD